MSRLSVWSRAASERRPKIAYGFNRGSAGKRCTSPGGAKEPSSVRGMFSVVHPGLDSFGGGQPSVELKRWAIFDCPFGTLARLLRPLRGREGPAPFHRK